MKSLVEVIAEALNGSSKELFNQIDAKLKDQEWDEIAPLIESICKSKWGKPIKLDNTFRDKIDNGKQHLLLGYNIKSKAWIIVRYNDRAHDLRGGMYDGRTTYYIGNSPTYWDSIPRYIETDNLKLRFGEAYEDDARTLTAAIDMEEYHFDD